MLDILNIRKRFPILQEKINGENLIYFDNGATTQKPKSVIDTVSKFYKQKNANIHRGVHFLSSHATEEFENTRSSVSEFIGAANSNEIIFTKGTTESINLVANGYKSILKKGNDVIISELEHHSNIVPWQICCQVSGANLKVIPLKENGELDLTYFQKILSKNTKLVAISHVSNTLGTINPIQEIIAASHKFGAKVLIDGAQAMSHINLNMEEIGADYYCFSGHKMYGPTGVGVLYGKESILNDFPIYQSGGEMIEKVSLKKTTYAKIPHKFEAGTPNIAGVVGLNEAIKFINGLGVSNIKSHEDSLLHHLTEKLIKIDGLKIYGSSQNKTAILSFNIDGLHHYDIGVLLDKMGIAIRTGHHCTQPIMEKYNILGTARVSLSVYNTIEEIDYFISAIRRIKNMLS
tara:strand:- start:2887 stop:4101 length:1215 start_codon:yes stop_codon:yes gene_type:complete